MYVPLKWNIVQWNPALRPPRYTTHLYDHLLITTIFFRHKRKNLWGPVQTPLRSWAEPNWIRFDFGATLAWQPIQAAYRVSILTFISCAEKGKSLGPIPYFSAIIDFLFVEDCSSYLYRSFSAGFIWIITFDVFVLFHALLLGNMAHNKWLNCPLSSCQKRHTEVFLAPYILYS